MFFRGRERLLLPQIVQRARKRGMFFGFRANDIDVFEAGLPIKAQSLQVPPKKPKPSRKRKIVISARTRMATRALPPKRV